MIPSSPLIIRLSVDQLPEIRRTKNLRETAKALRSKVSNGYYGEQELQKFWEMTENAGLILQTSNPELAERSGLGAKYFSSVSKDRRNPKLANMLKALTGIVETADERLADVERQKNTLELNEGWVDNPLNNNDELAEKIQSDLILLIRHLKMSNSLSEFEELDNNYRVSLINLLETTILLLKSPLIERSLISSTSKSLKKTSGKNR